MRLPDESERFERPDSAPDRARGAAALRVAAAVAVLVATLLATGGATAPGAAEPRQESPAAAGAPAAPETATVRELYPNPVADGNAGEYLIVDLPRPGNWSLSDGYHETPLPAGVTGRVALSREPAIASDHVDRRVYRLPEPFPLSAAGDRIALRHGTETVDAVAYERAREAAVWNRSWSRSDADHAAASAHAEPSDPDDPGWRPYGFRPREPVSTGSTNGTAFVLPDAPEEPVAPLVDAEDRLYVAAYTFDSARVTDALVAAAERGADARLLLEGSPVGGFPAASEPHLDRLAAAGVEVRVLDGPRTRFAFHHAKYAVADDRAVVLTENWKPAGTGGAGSRGWGVTLRDRKTADELAALFERDATAVDARPWGRFAANASFHGDGPASGSYPARFDPATFADARIEVLTAPGNAEDRVVARVDAADERVLGVVPRTGGRDQRIVRALGRATDRGVETRLLLSGAWYDREENAALAEHLSADRGVAAGVADGRGRYAKLHAKGLVIDDTAVIGSLNWNDAAAGRNREVLVAVEHPAVADFLAQVIAADASGGTRRLPVALLGGVLVALCGAGTLARRRVRFADR
ncbi:phospholipase D-like domain-containing protein [Haloparvum alkalitolerans]|uniref:phospholipase D-like domain-containing protein n=1 Tax=Haloparvum alkalitolerans TaxID=1042953 RepID=UPI003CEBF629